MRRVPRPQRVTRSHNESYPAAEDPAKAVTQADPEDLEMASDTPLIPSALASVVEPPPATTITVEEGDEAETNVFSDDGRLFVERDFSGGDVPRFSLRYPEGLISLVRTISAHSSSLRLLPSDRLGARRRLSL